MSREMSNKIAIYVATHKVTPLPDHPYLKPLLVGAALASPSCDVRLGRDNTGENISARNPNYCELTAAYWIWKNAPEPVVGLCHYRRFFGQSVSNGLLRRRLEVASEKVLLANLDSENCLLLPRKRIYWPVSVSTHYALSHVGSDLTILRHIVEQFSPQFLDSFDRVMSGSSLYLYNMFVCRKKVIEAYFDWLFAILERTWSLNLHVGRDSRQSRVYGFLAERLFTVWIHANAHRLRIKCLPVVELEPRPLSVVGFSILRRLGGRGSINFPSRR
jgi:hypothetical protein